MGATGSNDVVDRFVRLFEQRRQQEQDMIEQFVAILQEHEARFTSTLKRCMESLAHDSQTQREAIETALQTFGDSAVTVRDLARVTGIDESAVRVALYTDRERFERVETSPRRVAWRLKREESANGLLNNSGTFCCAVD